MISLFRATLLLCFALALPLAAAAISDPTPDPTAAVVLLRHTVHGGCGSIPLENCFETMAELSGNGSTTGWIWTTRQPSASAPLLVDIGPGEFGTFNCAGTGTTRGFVTLRGSGREQTILAGTAQGVKVTNCKNLSFIDLGAKGRSGAVWEGSEGGSSSWSNVDLVGIGTTGGPSSGWTDQSCDTQTTRSVHYFHGSRIRAERTAGGPYTWAVYSVCAELWIFGGEISLDISGGSTSNNFTSVIRNAGALVEVFGTAIRGKIRGSTTGSALVGVDINNGTGTTLPIAFHSHGSNIGLSTAGADSQSFGVIAITAADDVHVHSAGTAYALTPGSSGTVTRIIINTSGSGQPDVEAPFHWSADTSPPLLASSYASKNGEDLFVETDCTSTSCSGGTQPHLMIYSTACPSSNPWWDVATNACRQ
jgi:hypothetical protein